MCNENQSYQRLEKSLTDVIAEEQAKLGYRKEAIRLYYPLSSLNHFFDSDVSAKEMQEKLTGFISYVTPRFGDTKTAYQGDRFCFYLASEASEYVHGHQAENTFIFDLVKMLQDEGITLADITAFFRKWDKDCVVKDINNGEFDILITFTTRDDPYYYCFKDEGCHIIYHRFLPEDYEDFGF